MKAMIEDESRMLECAEQLAKSRVGRNAMKHALEWLDDEGLLLDFG